MNANYYRIKEIYEVYIKKMKLAHVKEMQIKKRNSLSEIPKGLTEQLPLNSDQTLRVPNQKQKSTTKTLHHINLTHSLRYDVAAIKSLNDIAKQMRDHKQTSDKPKYKIIQNLRKTNATKVKFDKEKQIQNMKKNRHNKNNDNKNIY